MPPTPSRSSPRSRRPGVGQPATTPFTSGQRGQPARSASIVAADLKSRIGPSHESIIATSRRPGRAGGAARRRAPAGPGSRTGWRRCGAACATSGARCAASTASRRPDLVRRVDAASCFEVGRNSAGVVFNETLRRQTGRSTRAVEEDVDAGLEVGVVVVDRPVHVADRVPELLAQHPHRREAEHRAVEVPGAVAPDHQAEVLLHHQPAAASGWAGVAGPRARPARGRRSTTRSARRVSSLGRVGRRQGGEHLVGALREQTTAQRQLGVTMLVDEEPLGEVEGPGAHPVVRRRRAQLELVEPVRRSISDRRPIRLASWTYGATAGRRARSRRRRQRAQPHAAAAAATATATAPLAARDDEPTPAVMNGVSTRTVSRWPSGHGVDGDHRAHRALAPRTARRMSGSGSRSGPRRRSYPAGVDATRRPGRRRWGADANIAAVPFEEVLMPQRDVSIPTPDGTCDASLHTPDGTGPWPAVIMFPDAGGVRPTFHDMAQQLADLGYAVLLPNLYYRLGEFEPFDMNTVFTDEDERNAADGARRRASPRTRRPRHRGDARLPRRAARGAPARRSARPATAWAAGSRSPPPGASPTASARRRRSTAARSPARRPTARTCWPAR